MQKIFEEVQKLRALLDVVRESPVLCGKIYVQIEGLLCEFNVLLKEKSQSRGYNSTNLVEYMTYHRELKEAYQLLLKINQT